MGIYGDVNGDFIWGFHKILKMGIFDGISMSFDVFLMDVQVDFRLSWVKNNPQLAQLTIRPCKVEGMVLATPKMNHGYAAKHVMIWVIIFHMDNDMDNNVDMNMDHYMILIESFGVAFLLE